MCKTKMNQDTDLKGFSKINSKWTIGLNVKQKAIELLEGNTAESLGDIGHGNFSFTDAQKQNMEEKR